MTFSLKLELQPGATYREIQDAVLRTGHSLPDDPNSKPDGPVHVVLGTRANTTGEWRLDR